MSLEAEPVTTIGSDAADLSATELVSAFRAGTLTPEDAYLAVRDRIRQREGELNAFYLQDEDGASAAARASTRRWADGAPLGPSRAARLGPGPQQRRDDVGQQRVVPASVLPREVGVPAVPAPALGVQAAHQAEVGHRDDPRAAAVAAAVGEGVELLQVADGEPGLFFDPGAHGGLQRAVPGQQGARGEPGGVRQGEHARFAVDHGDDDGQHLGADRFAAHHGEPPPGSLAVRMIPLAAT